MNNNITTNFNDLYEALDKVKDELYIFLMVLILWCIFKLQKIFVWVYHKVCPSEISRILDEPEEATEIISRLGSTTQQQQQDLSSSSPPISKVYSDRFDTNSTYNNNNSTARSYSL